MAEYIDVSYFDTFHGGSGLERMRLVDLVGWLRERPGVLIYGITPVGGLK